ISSAADKLKANKDVAQPLKDFGLRISKLLGLDEQQSVQILQCYLQDDYRGTRNTLKTVLQDERQSQALLLKIADYYYEERVCLLRCVLLLLTYFQDERHPYRAEYATCVSKLEKDLVNNYQQQFEALFNAEAPTWETHGNLMTERQVSRWFTQCLREQALLLEVLFLYYAYFEMPPSDLLTFTRLFKEQGFGQRQTNRHLVDKSMDALVDRIGYFSCLILVEGMDIDFLHKCALEDRTEQHQLSNTPDINKEMDQMLLTFGDISHHGPVLLAWVLLRHTLQPVEAGPVVRRLGQTTLQLGVFQYLTDMLKALGNTDNNCTASTARMCIYGLLSFVVTSFEEDTLGSQQHLINAACEVLAAPSLAELFWESPNVGLEMILDSAVGVFPHKTGPLLQLLTALLSDKSTAKRVYTFLDKMSFYTEVYKNKPNDVLSREDETLWRRLAPKLLYPLGAGQTNLRMPQGCYGQVCVGEQGYLVRWDYSYSSWTLFTCEIEMLLHVVSTADVLAHCERVKPILDLVHKIISTDWTVSDCLLPLTSRIYMLLQRLTSVINPPVDVIASCVNCLIVLATRQPAKVWSSLQHTGFLPFASVPLTTMAQTISAEGMKAGNYGNLLVLFEQPRGEYAVTVAFLRLVTTLVKGQVGSTQSKGLIPCVLLVLKEMLPSYHKWRYNTHGVREKIGCLILELVHAILNLSPEGDTPSLQSLCIYSLANTEAGQAVVNIMGVGVDTINVVLAAQPSSSGSCEGPGQVLIQTVKLAFSVTNNVIRLKPQSDTVSPLEQALTQHGGHGNNLIAVLAKYIYHKHDPALPRLAVQLLKRLASVAPMSVYACLGSDAAAIRDAFLTRLQSKTVDLRIKVTILEFLTVAVETQPGLIELFLNLETKDGSEGAKEFSLGEWSCLAVVLELLDCELQGQYWCPPLLQRAALAFLHALWQDRRDSALSVLRTKEKFWDNLTTPLFGTLPPPSETTEVGSLMGSCWVAFVLKQNSLICAALYCVCCSGQLEGSLKSALQRLSSQRRYEFWSQYVRELVCAACEGEDGGMRSLSESQMLISAWRTLLILSTSHSEVMQLKEDSVRLKLFMDVLEGTKAALLMPQSVACLRLGSMMATLLLVLLKHIPVFIITPALLPPLSLMLENVLQADQQLMERTKAKLFSALISALHIQGLNEITQLPQLLLCVCETVQDEAVALIDSTRHITQKSDAQEDSMETDTPRSVQKDQRDSVCVLALHLSKELCRADEDGEQWLQVMRKLPVLPSVLSALELSLRSKQNLYFTEAALHLLLTLARTPQGAAAVAGAGVIQSICLPLLSVYEGPANGATQAFSRKPLDAPCWPGVYRLCLSLMESLLKTLRYNFINEALDFVGVHQERILQCLSAVRTVQSLACLDEADHTVGFLLQLSSFCKEWQFHLPQLLRDVQVNLCYLCQTCTYLLHSKKMLHHYLQAKNGEALPQGSHPQRVLQPTSKEQPLSGEREEAESKALQAVQCSLLKILSKTLATLQHFTPDCCQILLDQSMDLAEYRTLFVLSFTTPAFDSDVAPSFGTLLATINVALSMLGEIEKKKEPAVSSEETQALKSLLMFSMENCFYVLISQAMRCLKDPAVLPRDKQRVKQELSSELSTLLTTLFRFFRRGSPSSPASGLLPSPQTKPTTTGAKVTQEGQEPFIQLVQAFVRHVQR
uniref:Nucleoporin NUP188 n=1 Tax=Pygocentrus nattereri TaxID=42514 RepID=A0AAR2KVL0_PYGNA